MASLGQIRVKDFLERTKGQVRGQLQTDAKERWYAEDYNWYEDSDGNILVQRANKTGDTVKLKSAIDISESLVAFFGLYSGDGSKGSEYLEEHGRIQASISFSQKEPNLVLFATEQFKYLFGDLIRFTFSLGEDSALFMSGTYFEKLKKYYRDKDEPCLENLELSEVRPILNKKDEEYLLERRAVPGTNESHLAFYYYHKTAMEEILKKEKNDDIRRSGIKLSKGDRVTASLRRPFKKGARQQGGSSRSDEIFIGGLNGFGEFFLKILHEIEESIVEDSEISSQGLIRWNSKPSQLGREIDIYNFYTSHQYGDLAGERPIFEEKCGGLLLGCWPRSKQMLLQPKVRMNPLWCYVAGLYLAEGATNKAKLFSMFKKKETGLSLAFTSSENTSIELVLRAFKQLFMEEDCLYSWKIKVGSQYFPELVVIGLKDGVPILRGGHKGQGKLLTMEVSLTLKEWALKVAPALKPFGHKFTHVEPTGAGLARIDFSASSSLCKWYFPILIYSVFGEKISNPKEGFVV